MYSVYRQRSRTHLFLQFCLFILDFLTLSSSTTIPVWVMNLDIYLYAYIFPTHCLNESSPSCLLIYVFKHVWDKESWGVMEKREPSMGRSLHRLPQTSLPSPASGLSFGSCSACLDLCARLAGCPAKLWTLPSFSLKSSQFHRKSDI